ncbi:MAG: carboxypeptidase-like regulatory domain-containing protein, partial [Gloeobacteraceae cyanobacterium ES-bin-316]|nr:carboxypeptidase-like regulatory domain-containing protein [Ferruginibacter sp.]
AANAVKGIVLESNKQGTFAPLAGASVVWLGTTTGVATDSNGIFLIPYPSSNKRLIISYAGYRPDTVAVQDLKILNIILGSNQ